MNLVLQERLEKMVCLVWMEHQERLEHQER